MNQPCQHCSKNLLVDLRMGYTHIYVYAIYIYIYMYAICIYIYIPYAPCMVLPTFGWFLGQMLVNIPYMEHMGIQSNIWGIMIIHSWNSQWPINVQGRKLRVLSTAHVLVVMKPWNKKQVLSSSIFQTDHGWILWYVGAPFFLPAFDATSN